jgi:ribosomal-protein-alanine N-acetyltransferase
MIILTERLKLRELVPNDWRRIHAYQSDSRYLRFYPWTERKPEEVREFLQTFLEWQKEKPRNKFQFAITPRDQDEKLIGNCGIRKAAADAWEADMGYEIDPNFWGRGYGTEAAQALLTFGFRELGLHRVWAHCIADNAASARVLEKVGLRWEGQLRENEWMKGRWWDTLIYGILDYEWEDHPSSDADVHINPFSN